MLRKELIVIMLLVIPGITRVSADNREYDIRGLRSIVVEYPDSVIGILNEAESAKTLPQYQIDLLKGVAYNEKRMFSLVERFAKQALSNDSIDNHPQEKLNALTMLANARKTSGDYHGCVQAASSGIEVARSMGNRASEYNLLTTMASVSFGMGNRPQGYDYLQQIISSGSGSESARELANVSAAYGVKVAELYTDGRYDDALTESGNRLVVIDKIDEVGGAPDGFTDQQRAYTYARIASSALKAGKKEDAVNAYASFNSTNYGQTVVGRAYITDYLIDSKQWQAVIDNMKPLYDKMISGDTINVDFHSVLYSNAMAYHGLGQDNKAFEYMTRANAVNDSLYNREKTGRADEMAAIFAINEKDVQLQKSKAESERRRILMLSAFGIAVVVVILLASLYVAYRSTLRRNKIASRQIDTLITQREIIHSRDKERTDEGYRQFEELERRILDGKNYIGVDYNREALLAECGIPSHRAVQLIREYSGLSISDYINKLRIEYSVMLINEHPEWTIDAVAASSGYARRATYYLNFHKFYGITPAQYRKQRNHSVIKSKNGSET